MKYFFYMIMPVVVLIVLANSSGAGLIQREDLTGSPLGVSTCNKCHTGGSFNAETTIELLNGADPVTEYIPGETYTLRVKVEGTGAEAFGFQLIALEDQNENAGVYGTAAMGTRVFKVDGKDYFEHSSPSGSGVFEIEWMAPEANTGSVDFYATGNAVNANGNTGGDQPATTNLTIGEGGVSGLEALDRQISFAVYPNPASDFIKLDLKNQLLEISAVRLLDINGRSYYESEEQDDLEESIFIGDLSSGLYIVQVATDEGLLTKKLMKL